MEGTPAYRVEARRLEPLRRLGFAAAAPALLTLLTVFAALLSVTVAVSVAQYNDSYQLIFWPPSADAYGETFGFLSTILPQTLALVVPPILLAAVPGSMAGYFVALKAPERLRRAGVFLFLAAWILGFERSLTSLHFVKGTFVGALFPWMTLTFPGAEFVVLFDLAMPPIALAVYSVLRGDFFGLVWPSTPGTRVQRFLREGLPRVAVGVLFGSVLAIFAAMFDGYTTEVYVGYQGSLWNFVSTMMSIIGGAPLGAAWVVLLLTLILAAYVLFVAGLWLIRFAGRRIPGPVSAARPDDRSLSDFSTILTSVAFAFLVVTAFLPIVVAAAFSFNGSDSMFVFEGWSPRWYHSFGDPEVTGLLEREDFRDLFFRSLGFAALVSGLATPFAVLAAATIHTLPPRMRAAIRGALYFGMAIPLVVYGSMTIFARHVAAPGYPVVPAEDAWAVVPVFLTYLPLALGVSFVVAASSASWRQAFYLQSMPFAWIRPAAGGLLISMAFVMSAYAGFIGESVTGVPIVFLSSGILSPVVDVPLVILAGSSLALLATGWVVRGDDERFRF
ncbi:MAG TPA: hypothetical protein VJ300_02475 [Thermoplasmata archaeon]|nr:hypothetical protein [Thermoplasmata archaeon]